MLAICAWVFVSGWIALASSQAPPGFKLPAIMRVERNWYVMASEPIGSFVTKVYRESTGGEPVTFGLETTGPPAPFKIDPKTGVVTVNDTLTDKENSSYSLWVTAYDGSIPQKTEVFATVTDNSGQRPKLPHPPTHLPFPPYPRLPEPKYTRTTQSTTKALYPQYIEETVPETTTTYTTLSPPKAPDDIPEINSNKVENDDKNKSSVPREENLTNEVPLTMIPLIAIGGLVVIVAAVILFVCKKNNAQKKDSKKDDMLSEETSISKDDQPPDKWEFPRHKLRIFHIVGEGAFGQVWRAQAIDIAGKKGEQTVAVKTLKENASEKEKIDLLQELLVMKNLGYHPNVVQLIGCCTEKEPTLVIMEFVSLGKLQQFLRDSRAERHYGNTHGSQFLTSQDLTKFAFQVARGMEFLSLQGIIHRDLAARNVLITEDRVCKVADFGFARDVADTHVYERKSDGRLPIRWMAPESLYDNIFSVKSDIWSFGILLWEIVTLGSTPYPGLSANDVMKKVIEGYRLEKPEHCHRELYNIMYYCWEAEPNTRPDFTDIVARLEPLINKDMDYIQLERFPDHSYYNLQHLDGEKL
ncbi:tyrosine kinase receptor Cad96Ca isoform X2 [Anticarsia gemmatalis]|uniref:tyrosine kinase receptor Cad96Ca isoform X2 n=1 Tax=Anticarsia gemmatalis TaxID=129554 RepID=UPI003F762360